MKLIISIFLIICCYKFAIAQDLPAVDPSAILSDLGSIVSDTVAVVSDPSAVVVDDPGAGVYDPNADADLGATTPGTPLTETGSEIVTETNNIEEEAALEEDTEGISGYTELDPAFVDNSPIIIHLVRFGVQYVVGQARDAGLVATTGNYTKIYKVEQMVNDTIINYKIDIRLLTNDNVYLHSKFLVTYNTATNLQRAYSFSFEYQHPTNVFIGRNVSYDSDNDTFNVTTWAGSSDWIEYQEDGLPLSTTSYEASDYLLNYVGYTNNIDVSSIYSNMKIQTSLNLGLKAVGSLAVKDGIWADSSNISASSIKSMYSLETTSTFYRYDVVFSNGAQNGRVVFVVQCPYDGVSLNCENAILQYYWFTALLGSQKTAYVLS